MTGIESRLLLVEDDHSLGLTLFERLKKEGYQVDWCCSIEQARDAFLNSPFELAILDVGLPDGSGFELAQVFRENSSMPFLFMTAASDAENRLQGFELGAEEFIPKPFHLKELLLRVKHVLENHRASENYRFLDCFYDARSMMVTRDSGEVYKLGVKENDVLHLLVRKSPMVVSREEILDSVWGRDRYPTNRTVDNIILKLRQYLGTRDGASILSVRGVGYQWLSEK